MMTKLIGNNLAQNYLSHVLSGPIEAQAYLVCGLPGLGKLTLVNTLVAEIHNKKSAADLQTDPDYKLVQTVDNKKDISIDQVREITEFLKLASWNGYKRVVVINDAENMNVQASNALLKTLEEPLGRAIIFLISSRPQLLLPTIKSRCQLVNMTPVNNNDLTKWLAGQGAPKDEVQSLLGLSQGRPGLALELLANKEFRSLRLQLAQEYLAFLKTHDISVLLDWLQANLVAKTSKATDAVSSNVGLSHKAINIINIWLEITRDLILCKYSLFDRVIYQSFLSETRHLADNLLVEKLIRTEAVLIEAQSKIKFNANIRLTVEWVLITIKVELLNKKSV